MQALLYLKTALRNITGQHPAYTKANVSVANFNLRKGAIGGVELTLRRDNLNRFVKNHLYVVGPQIYDRGQGYARTAGARSAQALDAPRTLRGARGAATGVTSFSVFPEAGVITAQRGRAMPAQSAKAHPLGGPKGPTASRPSRPGAEGTIKARFAPQALRSACPTGHNRRAAGGRAIESLRDAERILKGQLMRLTLKGASLSAGASTPYGGRGAGLKPGGVCGGGHVVFGFSSTPASPSGLRLGLRSPQGPRPGGGLYDFTAFILSANLLRPCAP